MEEITVSQDAYRSALRRFKRRIRFHLVQIASEAASLPHDRLHYQLVDDFLREACVSAHFPPDELFLIWQDGRRLAEK